MPNPIGPTGFPAMVLGMSVGAIVTLQTGDFRVEASMLCCGESVNGRKNVMVTD